MPEPTLIPASERRSATGRERLFRPLASLRLTLLGLLLLGAGGYAASRQLDGSQWLVIGALLLLSLNLVAALISNPVFRTRPALFGMHIGLLLLALSLAYGQATRFRGHFEITEGEAFDPARVVVDRKSPITSALPGEGAFVQGEVSVNYAPGLMRRETESRVERADGVESAATDGRPLIIDGYRFYVTHNKGFSALITWWPEPGAAGQAGTLHFPSYPRLAPMQQLQWTAPDGTALELEVSPVLPPQYGDWTLTRQMAKPQLRVARGQDESVLQAGERLQLPGGGMLRFERMNLWIGYRVFYDPSLTWCFAAALITVCCLAAHLLGGTVRRWLPSAVAHNEREMTI